MAEFRLFGVTTLDTVRSSTFIGSAKNVSPVDVSIPVIGGHSGATIIPVISASPLKFTDTERDALVQRIQFGGDEVVKAKNGAGSATLSMAYAGARFVDSLLQAAVLGKTGITECSFINTDVANGLEFFSTVVELGKNGVEKAHPIPPLSEFEQGLLAKAVPELQASITRGVDFILKASL